MISNLRRISEGLTSEFVLEKAIRLISIEACPSGKPARTHLFKFHSQSKAHLMASSYQNLSDLATACYATQFIPAMLSDGVYSNAMIELEHDSEFLEKFAESTGFVELDMWKTTFLIPLVPDFLVSLSLQSKKDGSHERNDYFRTLRAILQLYVSNLIDSNRDSKIITRPKLSKNIELRLTERQELILELIQTGKTNPAIARLLGYSESLIRQESISIYRKLGIKGRRDLEISAERQNRSN